MPTQIDTRTEWPAVRSGRPASPTLTVLEAGLEALMRRAVQAAEGKTIKLAPVEAGTPDRLVLLPTGRMYLVELKTETGAVSKIQRHWHDQARQLGQDVHVLYGAEGIQEFMAWATNAE